MSGAAPQGRSGMDTTRPGMDQQRLVGRGYVSSSALMNALKLPLSSRGNHSMHLPTSSKAATHSSDSPWPQTDASLSHTPPLQSGVTGLPHEGDPHRPHASHPTAPTHEQLSRSDQAPDASTMYDQQRSAAPSTFYQVAVTAPVSSRAPRYAPQQTAPSHSHQSAHPSSSSSSISSGSSAPERSSQPSHPPPHASNGHSSETQAAANAAAMEARKEQLRTFQQQKLSARGGAVFRPTQTPPSTDRFRGPDAARRSKGQPEHAPSPKQAHLPTPPIPKLSLGALGQAGPPPDSGRFEPASFSTPAPANNSSTITLPSRPPASASSGVHGVHRPTSGAAVSGNRQAQPPPMVLPAAQHAAQRVLPAWEGVRPIVSNRRMSVGGQMLEEPSRRAAQVPLPDMGDMSAFSTPRTSRGRVQSSGMGVITKSPTPHNSHSHHAMQNAVPWSPSLPAAPPASNNRPHSAQHTTQPPHPQQTNTHSTSSTPRSGGDANNQGSNAINASSRSDSSIGTVAAPSLSSTPRRPASAAASVASGSLGDELRSLRMQQLQWMVLNAKVEAATKARTHEAEQSLAALTAMNAHLRHSVSMGGALLARRGAAARLGRVLSEQGPLIQQWADVQDEHRSATRSIMTALQDTLVNVPLVNGAHIPGDRAAVVAQLQQPMAAALQALRSAEASLSHLLACDTASTTLHTRHTPTGNAGREQGGSQAVTAASGAAGGSHGGGGGGGGASLCAGVAARGSAAAGGDGQSASGVLRSAQLLGDLGATVAQELCLLLEVVGQVSRLSDVQLQLHSTVVHMLQLGREAA
ncbi:MAG: hypothetical protein WDW38_007084 [Sanguina aurantia]